METIDNTYSFEQKLDFILEFLRATPSHTVWHTKQLGTPFSELALIRKLKPDEFDYFLKKLHDEGYIEIDTTTGAHPLIKLTYKGYFFEGYKNQKKTNDIEIKYKDWTTYALIFGGLAGGFYYICQLLSPLFLHFFCSTCH